jgi:hypothetical protein
VCFGTCALEETPLFCPEGSLKYRPPIRSVLMLVLIDFTLCLIYTHEDFHDSFYRGFRICWLFLGVHFHVCGYTQSGPDTGLGGSCSSRLKIRYAPIRLKGLTSERSSIVPLECSRQIEHVHGSWWQAILCQSRLQPMELRFSCFSGWKNREEARTRLVVRMFPSSTCASHFEANTRPMEEMYHSCPRLGLLTQ